MIQTFQRSLRPLLSLALAGIIAALTACGGGGDSSATSTAATGGTTTTATTTTTPASTALLAPLQGTWKSSCTPLSNGNGIVVGSQLGYSVFTAPTSNGRVTGTATDFYFQNSTCSGTATASVTYRSAEASESGTKTISGLTYIKFNATNAIGTPTFTGTAYIGGTTSVYSFNTVNIPLGTGLNAVTYTIPIETITQTYKILLQFTSNNTQFNVGLNSSLPLDAQGYPAGISSAESNFYIKQ